MSADVAAMGAINLVPNHVNSALFVLFATLIVIFCNFTVSTEFSNVSY